MDKNLYRALVFWQDKYTKEHNEVERLKKELEEQNKRIMELTSKQTCDFNKMMRYRKTRGDYK